MLDTLFILTIVPGGLFPRSLTKY